MSSQEKRIQELETQVDKLYELFKLPAKASIVGNELISLYTPGGNLARYPYADVIASGQIDPSNDIVQRFVNVPNIVFTSNIETQIASYINSSPDFTKTGSEIYYFVVTRIILNNTFDSGFQTIRDFYRLSLPKDTYGLTSGNTVLTENLLHEFRLLDQPENQQVINYSATSPYSIENIVNTGSVFTPIESASMLFVVDVDSGTSTDYYLYQGAINEDIGTGEYQIQVGETRYLNTAKPDPYNSVIQNENARVLGWEYHQDGETTPATQTINTTPSQLLIDGLGSSTETSYTPLEIRGNSLMWDDSNDEIVPITEGDSYNLRLDLEITAKSGSPTILNLVLDIGTTPDGTNGTGSILVVNKVINLSKTPPYDISIGFPIFALSTFLANNGSIWLSTDTGSFTLAKRGIFIGRTSKNLG